ERPRRLCVGALHHLLRRGRADACPRAGDGRHRGLRRRGRCALRRPGRPGRHRGERRHPPRARGRGAAATRGGRAPM
ncbi:MAG: hypothetical protein AVDCRST_MAG79-1927, partial [uncultured Thermoleophilia bacterium]